MAAVRSRVWQNGSALVQRLFVAMCLVLWPVSALAHAQLQTAVPPANAILGSAPQEVVLTFNEPVELLSALWSTPDGATHAVAVRAENARLFFAVPTDAGRGTHVLTWRVVSEDGHPVGGAHVFSVGEATLAAEVRPQMWPARMAALARAALTLVLAFGVGGLAAAVILAAPVPVDVRTVALTTPGAAIFLLTAQAADLGGGFTALGQLDAWLTLRSSPFLFAALLALMSLGLALTRNRLLAIAALVVGGMSFAVAGHAGTAATWSGVVVMVHAGLGMFWAGSLALLATRDGRATALAPFGRIAPVMLGVLVAAGGALALAQLEPGVRGWTVLRETAYGQVLGAKLGLVALVLGCAALNRWRFARLARAGGDRGLRRSIRLEIVLMIGVLLLTAAFRLTPPPRALAETTITAHFHGRLTGADMQILPGLTGWNRVEIVPHGADFGPFVPKEMTLAFTHVEAGIGPIEVQALADADGLWHAETTLPMPGEWSVVLRILVDDFTQERLGSAFRIE